MPQKTNIISTMPELLFTLDIEASSLSNDSFPVSLGIAGPSGRSWHYLVKPQSEWEDWDELAEEEHGISRGVLDSRGWDVCRLCRELNQQFYGLELLVDSPFDLFRINKLYDAAGLALTFTPRLIHEALAPKIFRSVIAAMERDECLHRADADARTLRDAIVLQLSEPALERERTDFTAVKSQD